MDEEVYDRKPDYRPHRKNFSRIGWALTALLLAPLAVELVPMIIMARLNVPLLQDEWFSLAMMVAAQYLVGYPLTWFLMRRVPEGEGEVRPLPRGMLLRALFISLAALYLTSYFTGFITDVIGSLRGSPVVNPVDGLGEYPLAFNFVLTCVLAPLAEEAVFRGLVLNRLRPYGERFAVLASAVAFAMLHGNLSQMLYAFTVGLVFGYVAVVTGQIRQTALLHACVNFIGGFLPLLIGVLPQEGGIQEMAAAALLALVFFSILMGIIFFLRCRRSLWLEPGDGGMSEGRKWGLLFGNPGMVVFTLAVLAEVALYLFGM